MSYAAALAYWANRDPDFEALCFEKERISRRELLKSANRLARDYAHRGVTAGSFVCIGLPNSSEFLVACLATWKLGATPQPISHRLPERERREIIELAKPSLVVGVSEDCSPFNSVPAGHQPDPSFTNMPLPDCIPDYARAMTSGGSTGRPKLIVEHSPAQCDPEIAENGMRCGGTTLVPGPLYHAGPFITCWQTLLCGGRVVLLPRFDPEQCLATIQAEKVNWVLFVPTMLHRIYRLANRLDYDLSSLERVMSTGAPCPTWLKREWIDWIGPKKMYEAYGGSERIAGTQISGTEWLSHPGSVGKPIDQRKLKIVDSTGDRCGVEEVGEVYMMPSGGPGSTYHYIGATAKADAEGWESLGDMGYLDADGYLYLVDRKKRHDPVWRCQYLSSRSRSCPRRASENRFIGCDRPTR